MNKSYVSYRPDGEIAQLWMLSEEALAIQPLPEGHKFLEAVAQLGVHYVTSLGELAEKQDYTLDALPLPCTVTIEGVVYECTEQPTFQFNYPGTYVIQVDAGPAYLKKEFELDYQP